MRQLAANDEPSLADTVLRSALIEILRQMQGNPCFENIDLVGMARRKFTPAIYAFALGWAHALPREDKEFFCLKIRDAFMTGGLS